MDTKEKLHQANKTLQLIREEHSNFVRNVYKVVNKKKGRLKEWEQSLNKLENELLKKDTKLNYIFKENTRQREKILVSLHKEEKKLEKLQAQEEGKLEKLDQEIERVKATRDKLRNRLNKLNRQDFELDRKRAEVTRLIKEEKDLNKLISQKRNSLKKERKQTTDKLEKVEEETAKLEDREEAISKKEAELEDLTEEANDRMDKATKLGIMHKRKRQQYETLLADVNAVIRQRQLKGELNKWRKKK